MSLYLRRLRAGLTDRGAGVFIPEIEDLFLALHNQLRRDYGLAPLRRSAELDVPARAHAADLLHRAYFAHQSPEGFNSGQRVGLLARRFLGAAGENLVEETGGSHRPSAAELTALWAASLGHRANMLRESYTDVGFGVAGSARTTLAVAVFGQTYADLSAPAPVFVGDGAGLRGVLEGASSDLVGYSLQPLQNGPALGPFALTETPNALIPGAYAIRPHAPDRRIPGRYWILNGPIVLAG